MIEQTSLLEEMLDPLRINNRLAEIEAERAILRRMLPLAIKAQETLREREEDHVEYRRISADQR